MSSLPDGRVSNEPKQQEINEYIKDRRNDYRFHEAQIFQNYQYYPEYYQIVRTFTKILAQCETNTFRDKNSPRYTDKAIGIQLYCCLLNLLSYIYLPSRIK